MSMMHCLCAASLQRRSRLEYVRILRMIAARKYLDICFPRLLLLCVFSHFYTYHLSFNTIDIADVSYFVPHNSLLDIEARDRGTTVYLADRRIDMLPSILSEHVRTIAIVMANVSSVQSYVHTYQYSTCTTQLCSLREGKDRYAVSVVITVDTATDLVTDVWYGRTVIRSRHAFSYEEVRGTSLFSSVNAA